jgi:hypothetical protein
LCSTDGVGCARRFEVKKVGVGHTFEDSDGVSWPDPRAAKAPPRKRNEISPLFTLPLFRHGFFPRGTLSLAPIAPHVRLPQCASVRDDCRGQDISYFEPDQARAVTPTAYLESEGLVSLVEQDFNAGTSPQHVTWQLNGARVVIVLW